MTPDDHMARHRLGRAYSNLRKWNEALMHLSKAIELDMSCWSAWSERGAVYMGLSQSNQALADFSKAIEISPGQSAPHHYLALARLAAGDLTGYRSECAAMLQRFGQTDKPEDANWVAWTCALHSDAVKDLHQPVQIAERAVGVDPKNISHTFALGATLYRAGRFAEAIKPLNEASAAAARGEGGIPALSPAYTWFFLAMANHQLGQAEEGRQWLDKAVKQMEQDTQNKDAFWNRRLTLHLFHREAENLLNAPAKPNEKSE
jgi:tetratricopeptide (TPR) repeat protein